MSNYPDGCPGPRRVIETIICGHCEEEWEVEMVKDLGMTDFFNEEDAKCPNCGAWCDE